MFTQGLLSHLSLSVHGKDLDCESPKTVQAQTATSYIDKVQTSTCSGSI